MNSRNRVSTPTSLHQTVTSFEIPAYRFALEGSVSMAKTARVYLIRHGETDANVQKIIQGHLDTQLNATGKRQAQIVGETLRSVRFVAAFTSDLSRAREVGIRIYVMNG